MIIERASPTLRSILRRKIVSIQLDHNYVTDINSFFSNYLFHPINKVAFCKPSFYQEPAQKNDVIFICNDASAKSGLRSFRA